MSKVKIRRLYEAILNNSWRWNEDEYYEDENNLPHYVVTAIKGDVELSIDESSVEILLQTENGTQIDHMLQDSDLDYTQDVDDYGRTRFTIFLDYTVKKNKYEYDEHAIRALKRIIEGLPSQS